MNDQNKQDPFVTTWRNKWITSHATSIDDFIDTFEYLAEMFKKWKQMGIKLLNDRGVQDDYARFFTHDKEVAIKANFIFEMQGKKFLEKQSGKRIPLE
jgi:hypothetical protein